MSSIQELSLKDLADTKSSHAWNTTRAHRLLVSLTFWLFSQAPKDPLPRVEIVSAWPYRLQCPLKTHIT